MFLASEKQNSPKWKITLTDDGNKLVASQELFFTLSRPPQLQHLDHVFHAAHIDYSEIWDTWLVFTVFTVLQQTQLSLE